MKNKITTILIIVVSAAAGVVGSFLVFHGGETAEVSPGVPVKGTQVIKTDTKGSVKKVTTISLVENGGGKSVRIVESEQIRPGAVAEEDVDEENLSDAQKAVLKELQDALDDNDIRRVRKALSKFLAKSDAGGLDGKVPVCLRRRAVEALGWFGKDAAVDLIGFVADANEEVSKDAFSAVEQALSDCAMGDRERSTLVTSLMTALDDADQIDSLLSQLWNMRNSVKADTARAILQNGSDVAKGKMLEELESYFDDEVTDVDSLEKWKVMNPDDPDDGELYDGEK